MIIDTVITDISTIQVTAVSDMTGDVATMDLNITPEDFEIGMTVWNDGELLQRAFPTLNAGEREFLKSGIHPKEWDAMFNGDDDDEDEEIIY